MMSLKLMLRVPSVSQTHKDIILFFAI